MSNISVNSFYKNADPKLGMLRTALSEHNMLITDENNTPRQGTYHLRELYDYVKANLAWLCEDEDVTNNPNDPKWQHAIRCELQRLKDAGLVDRVNGKRGFWKFS